MFLDYLSLRNLVILLSVVLLMYALRSHMLQLIAHFFRLIYKQCRLMAAICTQAEQRLRLRQYEVTRAFVESLSQRRIERRYGHIENTITNEVASYHLNAARLQQQLEILNSDYENSAELPPPSPEWVAAVEAIAQLESSVDNSDLMAKILADMHSTVQTHQQDAMREHRWSMASRHQLLSGLEPQWQALEKMLSAMGAKINRLQGHLVKLDQQLLQYELLTSGNGQNFMASMSVRFIVAMSLLLASLAVGYLNAELLQQALLAGMAVPLASPLGVIGIHSVVIILAALLLFDSLGLTKLIPALSQQKSRIKQVVLALASVVLLAMSGLSAIWVAGFTSFSALLAADLSQWTLALVSFCSCWVLALSVLPLEYAMQASRPIAGSLLQLLLRLLATGFRVLSVLVRGLGRFVAVCYEMVILVPALCEARLRRSVGSSLRASSEAIAPTEVTFNEQAIVQGSNVTRLNFSTQAKQK